MSQMPPPLPPPPGQQPPPGNRPRTLRTVLIAVAVVLGVCVLLGSVGGFFVVRGFLDATAPVRDTTRAFITELEQGEHTGAYQQLCQRSRDRYSFDEFERRADALGPITDHRLVGVSVHRTTGGGGSATVTARLTRDDGSTVTHTFEVVREGDQWRVCGNPF